MLNNTKIKGNQKALHMLVRLLEGLDSEAPCELETKQTIQ